MDLRVGLRLPACDRVDRVADAVAYAEAKGFDSVWIPDSQLIWRDTFASLCLAAKATSRITLATGVTNVVSRHPTVVAAAARTVQELAPNRFVLGVGAGWSASAMIGSRSTPTRRLEEAIEALRDLWTGHTHEFGGTRQRLFGDPDPCPIYLGAGGPRNTRLACERADGIILSGSLSPAQRQESADHIRELLAGSADPERPFDVVLWIRTQLSVAGQAEPSQWKPSIVIALMNLEPEAVRDLGVDPDRLREARGLQSDGTHSADWVKAVESCDRLISDAAAVEYARRYCLYGTPTDIQHEIAALAGIGIGTIITTPLAGDTTSTLPYEFMDSMAAGGLVASREGA